MKIHLVAHKCHFEIMGGHKMMSYLPFSSQIERRILEVSSLGEIEEAQEAFAKEIGEKYAGSYFVQHWVPRGERKFRGYLQRSWRKIEVERKEVLA